MKMLTYMDFILDRDLPLADNMKILVYVALKKLINIFLFL